MEPMCENLFSASSTVSETYQDKSNEKSQESSKKFGFSFMKGATKTVEVATNVDQNQANHRIDNLTT